jgi:hypothetical protein
MSDELFDELFAVNGYEKITGYNVSDFILHGYSLIIN